jgi:hypothetical protein
MKNSGRKGELKHEFHLEWMMASYKELPSIILDKTQLSGQATNSSYQAEELVDLKIFKVVFGKSQLGNTVGFH